MAARSMTKRTAALLAALVLAGLAAATLFSYTRGLEEEAFAGAETVQVFVAKEDIPAGTSGEAAAARGLIERTGIPAKVRAADAVASLGEIKDRIAAVDILEGEQIVGARFVVPGQAKGILPIPEGRQAISVQVGLPPSVGGFVQPGDHVSVIAQLTVPAGGADEARVQFLLQDVPVLAVGARVVAVGRGQAVEGEEAVAEQQGSTLLTLALTPPDAEKLAYAVLQGQLYFTLLPNGQKPSTTPGRTKDNAFA